MISERTNEQTIFSNLLTIFSVLISDKIKNPGRKDVTNNVLIARK